MINLRGNIAYDQVCPGTTDISLHDNAAYECYNHEPGIHLLWRTGYLFWGKGEESKKLAAAGNQTQGPSLAWDASALPLSYDH